MNKKKKETHPTRERKIRKELGFPLEKGKVLSVTYSLFGPGITAISVSHEKNGKVNVFVSPSNGSYFRFKKSAGDNGNFIMVRNPNDEVLIEDIINGRFWGQFTWGQLFDYQKPKFQRKIRNAIKKLVADFEAKAAKELNAIPKPSPKGQKGKSKR